MEVTIDFPFKVKHWNFTPGFWCFENHVAAVLDKSETRIDQFRYIKTIGLSTRLWGIETEFVGFIPQSLVLMSIA